MQWKVVLGWPRDIANDSHLSPLHHYHCRLGEEDEISLKTASKEFHLIVVVVLCEAGQTWVDVGSKEWEVDLELEIFNKHTYNVKYIFSKLLGSKEWKINLKLEIFYKDIFSKLLGSKEREVDLILLYFKAQSKPM